MSDDQSYYLDAAGRPIENFDTVVMAVEEKDTLENYSRFLHYFTVEFSDILLKKYVFHPIYNGISSFDKFKLLQDKLHINRNNLILKVKNPGQNYLLRDGITWTDCLDIQGNVLCVGDIVFATGSHYHNWTLCQVKKLYPDDNLAIVFPIQHRYPDEYFMGEKVGAFLAIMSLQVLKVDSEVEEIMITDKLTCEWLPYHTSNSRMTFFHSCTYDNVAKIYMNDECSIWWETYPKRNFLSNSTPERKYQIPYRRVGDGIVVKQCF